MNIIVLGYMGSGKSVVGKTLAKEMDWEYLDLDHYIEEREGASISDIFESRGEIYFRKKEALYLANLLEEKDNTVLSLGGGTPCFANNLETIKKSKNTISVYLHTSLKELTERLFVERGKRPLIAYAKTKEELNEFIGKHLFERSFYYNQATYKVSTDKKSPLQIAAEIRNLCP